MATVVRENIGLLHDKITVKVNKDDYYPSFEKKIKEYSKTANIPGFRKGMVPAGIIKKMYGNSLFTDEILKSVEKELYTYLNNEKPEIFAQPLPLPNNISSVDSNNPVEHEFSFEMGLKPAFTLPDFEKVTPTFNKVAVTDAMVDEEIGRMQIKAGKMTEPEQVDNEDNVLNLAFTETDKEGNIIEGGVAKDTSVILKYFTSAIQKEFKGKKVGDAIALQLNKAFDADKLVMMLQDFGLEKEDTEAGKKYFSAAITKIGLVEKREMNEEFFNEVYPGKNIATEAELRTALKEEIQQYWDAQSRNQLHDQLYHYILDNTSMDFPADFLKRWLQNGGEQTKTEDQAEKEYPGFSNQLKWTLITDKLIQDNKLEVTNDELKDNMRNEIMRYFGTMGMGDDTSWLESYVDRMMKDEKQVDSSYRRLITEKIFNWVESQVTPKEKEVTPEALTAMQHNHQH
ncbi:MAG: trigger factor [Chitinophagaceae bacterium]|nr:trigger factor [Chitinophagaceae bacterium]